MQAIIVVPTIREQHIQAFLQAWQHEFSEHRIFVIEDNPTRTFQIEQPNVTHYAWEDIDKELGDKAWIIPRRTDCIRSFGYYKAFQEQPDMVVTLDDDCYPVQDASDITWVSSSDSPVGPSAVLEPAISGEQVPRNCFETHSKSFLQNQEDDSSPTPANFLLEHYKKLTTPATSPAWISTGDGPKPRGIPYYQTQRANECVLNHGLWQNIPDFDAVTQLSNAGRGEKFVPKIQVVPRGQYFPMCGMNIAFKPKIIPALYFLLMGKNYPYDRFGDIWAGLFLKKISDHLGYAVTSGTPFVEHQRASNVWTNLKKEAPGLEVNENLWAEIDSISLCGESFGNCYRELAEKLPLDGQYWNPLKLAMKEWVSLFDSG